MTEVGQIWPAVRFCEKCFTGTCLHIVHATSALSNGTKTWQTKPKIVTVWPFKEVCQSVM
jgi:hypothetical protein